MTRPTGSVAGTSPRTDDRPLRVVSIPAIHPYAQRISTAPDVELLPDPPVPGAIGPTWWPPVALDPEWITAHGAEADILHIHFGTESFTPEHLTACLDAAHAVGWPVVFTAHDLSHPQLDDQELYDRQLDVLIPGADAVVTLTAGAADEIRRRWGRDPVVIAHPSLLDTDEMPRVLGSDEVRIGVHLKDLRPSADGPGTVRALLSAVDRLRARGLAAVAEVRLHHDVRNEATAGEVRRLCAEAVHASLLEHERLSDAELRTALSRLDACVLPYVHGTHSGWLELCWDLGVPVAAPALGHFAEQHDDSSVAAFIPGDVGSLAGALETLLRDPKATRHGTDEREETVAARILRRRTTDALSAAAHADLYRSLLAERMS